MSRWSAGAAPDGGQPAGVLLVFARAGDRNDAGIAGEYSGRRRRPDGDCLPSVVERLFPVQIEDDKRPSRGIGGGRLTKYWMLCIWKDSLRKTALCSYRAVRSYISRNSAGCRCARRGICPDPEIWKRVLRTIGETDELQKIRSGSDTRPRHLVCRRG